MSFLFGLFTAALAADLTWQLGARALNNLPDLAGKPIASGLVALAVVVGYLGGSALWRRARHTRDHLSLFGATAFAFAGGLLGGLFALTITVSYLAAYGTWPDGVLDTALTALAVPALALLGAALGALVGSAFGLVAGTGVRLLTFRMR